MTKAAYLFIFDRVTGKPIYDVKEVPVPQSNVTDEKTWPTQPVPVTPPPLARQSFTAATDTVNLTPELESFCKKMIVDRKLHDSVPFSPLTMEFPDRTFPGKRRRPRMGAAALSIPSWAISSSIPKSWVRSRRWRRSRVAGGLPPTVRTALHLRRKNGYMPCHNPPWGNLYAVNVNTGKIAWRVNLGVTDSMPEGQAQHGTSQLGRTADHRQRPDLHRRHR